MKTCFVVVAGLVLAVLGVALAPRASGADSDVAALKQRAVAFTEAWGKHDPKALAAFWAEDGDLINPWGRLATGRSEVEKLFADEHTGQGPMRSSTIELRSAVARFPSPGVAVEDWELLATGVVGPDGSKQPPVTFHVTIVTKKVGDAWLTYAARPYVKPPAKS